MDENIPWAVPVPITELEITDACIMIDNRRLHYRFSSFDHETINQEFNNYTQPNNPRYIPGIRYHLLLKPRVYPEARVVSPLVRAGQAPTYYYTAPEPQPIMNR